MGNILVLNMGMKSIRSIIFNLQGEKLASAARPLETFLNEECVTQDPLEWWEKAGTVIRESLIDVGADTIDYITVTTSSACLVYIDANGNPLDKCIMVSDKRADKESDELNRLPEFAPVQRATGLAAAAYLMLPKIMWVQKNQPELFNRVYKFLSPNDYLIGKMTNEYVTDCFNATKFHYDMAANTYPLELLATLGINKNTLPEIVSVGSTVGSLTAKAAAELGLPDPNRKAIKVIASTYDAICSFFGSGVAEEGDAGDISGTVTVLRALSYKQDLKDVPKILTMAYDPWQMKIVGGSNNLGGGLIEWVKQCYYHNEVYPYEIMEKDAAEARLGADGLVFLPYLMGERAPIWDNDARGVFFGLERTHTRKQMTRAVFESTGFIVQDMLNAIRETGATVKRIRLSGGLARLNLIAEIKADVTGLEVEVLSEFETTSTGAAMLALIGLGHFQGLMQAADKFAAVRKIIRPNKANHAKYQKIFQLYKNTYQALKPMFTERMELVRELQPKHEVRIENL